MKILFFCWEYPPHAGGVGAYHRRMAEALVAAGHEAWVLCGRAEGRPEESLEAGVRVFRAYDRAEIGANRVTALALDLARRLGADWIHAADHLGDAAGLLAQSDRPRVVVKAHACNALRALQNSQVLHPWQRPLIWLATRRIRAQVRRESLCLSGADVLTSPCERMLEELRAQSFPLPVRTAVLPNPVEVAAEPPARCESAAPSLFFAGRLDIGKGIAHLPDVMDRVSSVHPGCTLRIAGSGAFARGLGPLDQWLRRRLRRHADRVVFLGSIGREAIDAELRSAWVTVVPSRWDTFPNVVLEAMAQACPLVVSPYGGMPEMVAGTGTAVCDPAQPAFAQAVLDLLGDPQARADQGRALHMRARSEYSYAHCARAFVDALHSRSAIGGP